LVGVITSTKGLRTAIGLRNPPDLFELRFDHLWPNSDTVEKWLPTLRTRGQMILTARHPIEGGANNLSLRQRRELLLRFLPHAKFIDIELRSAKSMASIIKSARQSGVHLILSFHDFRSTPALPSLQARARAAKKYRADIFKVATRTDSKSDLARLVDFFQNCDINIPISAMGMGKFGYESRKELAGLGSVLNYGSIGPARVTGQPSIAELKKWIADATLSLPHFLLF
jgi:3-dehydroquinate dehydratase-1